MSKKEQSNKSKQIATKDLESLYGQRICTQVIKFTDELFGDERPRSLQFDIYDGFAYCGNFEGEEYYMIYPRKEFINISIDMKQAIKEFMGLNDGDEIKITDILITYNTLYKI